MKAKLILATVALVAIIQGGSTETFASPTTLKMWTLLSAQTSDPRSAALHSIIDDFNKSQSEYQIEVQSIDFGRIDNMVIQATAAGQGPDIVNVYSDLLPMHIAANTIIPLDKYLNALSSQERGDFVVSLKFMTFDSHVMAMPWDSRVWLYWYRSDLFAKAGLQVPRTLDELGKDAGAISTEQVMGFAMGASEGQLGAGVIETFIPLLWGAGGDLLDSSGHAAFNSEAGVKTLSFLRDLISKYRGMRPTVVSLTPDDVLSSVKAGTIATTIQGSHRISAARNAAATGDNLKTAPIPGWTAEKPTPARLSAQTLAIGANSKHGDGAWKFIMYHLSHESQLKFARAGVMPSRQSTYADPFFTETPVGKEMQGWSVYAHDFGRMESMPSDYPKLAGPLAHAVQEVLVTGKDPKAALDAAAAQYNALHK